MKRKRTRKYSAAALLAGLLLPAAYAPAAEKKQTKFAPQALLTGTVFQEDGFLLRGARVVVYPTDRPKEKRETVTDLQGEYAVRVPAGKARYTIEASAPGFATESKTAEVSGDERVEVNFRLAPARK